MFHNGRTFKRVFILNTRLSMTYKNEFRNLNLFKTILLLETFYLSRLFHCLARTRRHSRLFLISFIIILIFKQEQRADGFLVDKDGSESMAAGKHNRGRTKTHLFIVRVTSLL